MSKQFKVVITERFGDTVMTGFNYSDALDDAKELFEKAKLNVNVVEATIWMDNFELERYIKPKNVFKENNNQ